MNLELFEEVMIAMMFDAAIVMGVVTIVSFFDEVFQKMFSTEMYDKVAMTLWIVWGCAATTLVIVGALLVLSHIVVWTHAWLFTSQEIHPL